MILMIDNYDSFTYNLVQYFGELGAKLKVLRNDAITVKEIEKLLFSHIVISPGPGKPHDAGISEEVVIKLGAKIPILGVCLGHQAIAEGFGAKIVKAKHLMHGKTSFIYHNKKGIFQKIPNPFQATRYHSLLVKKESLPACLDITAWTKEGEIMGIKHKRYPIFGVQFHPESILTSVGHDILRSFLKY